MAQFWFNFNNAWSGQKYYTEGAIQLFNLLFTSIPILMLGVYDMDISPSAIVTYPQLYRSCIENDGFKSSAFWVMILEAVAESVLLSVLPLYYLENSNTDSGVMDSFWKAGATCFTCVIIVVNFKIFMFQSRWTSIHFLAIIFSIISWFAAAFFISSFLLLDYNWYQLFKSLMVNGTFWLTVIYLVSIIAMKDIYIAAWFRCFRYTPLHIIQEVTFTPHHTTLSDVIISCPFLHTQDPELTSISPVPSLFSDGEHRQARLSCIWHFLAPGSEDGLFRPGLPQQERERSVCWHPYRVQRSDREGRQG